MFFLIPQIAYIFTYKNQIMFLLYCGLQSCINQFSTVIHFSIICATKDDFMRFNDDLDLIFSINPWYQWYQIFSICNVLSSCWVESLKIFKFLYSMMAIKIITRLVEQWLVSQDAWWGKQGVSNRVDRVIEISLWEIIAKILHLLIWA